MALAPGTGPFMIRELVFMIKRSLESNYLNCWGAQLNIRVG